MMGLFSCSKTAPKPTNASSHSFSDALMDDAITAAGELITKWDISSTSGLLFSGEDRHEAAEFLVTIADVQQSMQFYVAHPNAHQHYLLVRAQSLMKCAMQRLQKEFYRILADNRHRLDLADSISGRSSSYTATTSSSGSVSAADDDEEVAAAFAMSDLRSIADCMIGSGYGKECAEVYKIIRKSIVDESLYRMGFVAMSGHQLQRLEWEKLEHKMKTWVGAFREAFRNIFPGERALTNHVFFASDAIKESCFFAVTSDASLGLLAFPELVAGKCKKLPERMFKFLDIYDAVAELRPEIDVTFSGASSGVVLEAVEAAAARLAEAVRVILSEFEAAIQKDPAKGAVPGGGIHPATRYVMNYVCFLADYSNAMAEILADMPQPVLCLMLPDSLLADWSSSFPPDEPLSSVSSRLAWTVLVLLFKLDSKAELYKDAGLSYLFLCNNLHYVVGKVRGSGGLRVLLGEEWVVKHEEKTRLYASNYERMVWSRAAATAAAVSANEEDIVELLKRFNLEFDEAYRRQVGWVVADKRLREDIKASAARAVVPRYRELYIRHRAAAAAAAVWMSPEDLEKHLSGLFVGESGHSRESSR